MRDVNCRPGIAQGFVAIPALNFSVKTWAMRLRQPTITKVVDDGGGRELVTSNTLAVPNGQAMQVKVRDAKSVRVTAAGPTAASSMLVDGLTASPVRPGRTSSRSIPATCSPKAAQERPTTGAVPSIVSD